MQIDMKQDELYHYGRLGMKWGKHIFGKDRFGSERKKKSSRTDQAEEAGGSSANPKPKSHKNMTDEELRKATDRLNLEANYLNAKSRANPTSQSNKKQSFANKFVKDAIQPALVNAGRTQIEKYLNKEVSKLLGDKDSIESLRKQAEKLGLESKISTSKKILASNGDWFEQRKKNKP